MTTPLVIAALGLLVPVPEQARILTGGPLVAWNCLCMAILAPYIIVLFLGLGFFVVRASDERLASAEFYLLQFFAGAALAIFTGVGLGAASLLTPWITIPFCVIVVGWYLAQPRPALGTPRSPEAYLLAGLLGLSALVLLLVKGLLLDVATGDVPHLYLPLLADLHDRQTILLDPESPKLFWFLLVRGHGADMLLVSFAGPYVHQVLSIIYLLSVAALVHQIVARIATGWVLPGCAALIALWSSFIGLETGRFHYEVGAFLLFICWAGLLLVTKGAPAAATRALLLSVIAVGVIVPQAELLAAMFLTVSAGIAWFVAGLRGATIPLGIAIAGIISAALSLALNQLYLGIAEVNPSSVFVPFANVERFNQVSSMDLMAYVNNAQGIKYVGSSVAEIQAAAARLWTVLSALLFSADPIFYVLFIVGSAGLLCSEGPGWDRSDGNGPFIIGLGLSMASVLGLLTITSHGSLERMLSVRSVSTAIAAVILGVALAGLARRLGLARSLPRVATVLVIILAVVTAASQHREITRSRIARAWAFVSGRTGLVGASPAIGHLDPRLCLEVASHVPEDWRILPVNSALRFLPTCAYSPLLPSGKVVETLHPVFLPKYREVLLGPPQVAMEALRRYNVNAFYVENEKLDFFAHGQSPLFDEGSLRRNLDVLYVGPGYTLLTWKGEGAALTESQISSITALRERSRVVVREYWEGISALRR